MLEALGAALDVHPDTFQVGAGRAFEQTQVRAPNDGKQLDRLRRIRLLVVESLCPEVLVVAGERRSILREHQPEPPRANHFGIGKMLQYLDDRPLPRHSRLAKFLL